MVRRILILSLLPSMPSTALSAPATAERTLDNGLHAIAQQTRSSEVFCIDVVVRSDPSEDGDLPGLRCIAAGTMLAGAEGWASERTQALLQGIDEQDGSTGGRATDEFVEVHISGPASFLDEALAFMIAALKSGAYPEDAVKAQAQAQAVFIDHSAKEPNLEHMVRRVLYPVPQVEELLGTPESLSAITRERVADLARRLFAPGRVFCAIVAPRTPGEILDAVAGLCADWPGGEPAPALPDWREAVRQREQDASSALLPLPYRSQVIEAGTAPVAQIMFGFEVPPVAAPDWPLADLTAALLDPAASGRLSTEPVFERSDASAGPGAAGVACSSARAVAYNHMVAFAYARGPVGPQITELDWYRILSTQATQVDESLRHAIRSLAGEPPSKAEMERARRLVLGSNRMRLASARDRAQYLALMRLAGVEGDPLEWYETAIRQATADDVVHFAATYLTLDKLAMAVLLPAQSQAPGFTGFPQLQ